MPLFTPPIGLLILLNVIGWGALHMIVAFGGTQLPRTLLRTNSVLFSNFSFENRLYKALNVHQWKEYLPDGAAWFASSFHKKHLQSADAEYIENFIRETCWGEATHWLVVVLVPLFFLFNPREIWWVHMSYALAANLPCIIIQRYNRPRLKRLLAIQVNKTTRKS